MKPYRICIIDKAGHLADVYETECDSDEEAYHRAETVSDGRLIDIWQGDRWIAWLEGTQRARIS